MSFYSVEFSELVLPKLNSILFQVKVRMCVVVLLFSHPIVRFLYQSKQVDVKYTFVPTILSITLVGELQKHIISLES